MQNALKGGGIMFFSPLYNTCSNPGRLGGGMSPFSADDSILWQVPAGTDPYLDRHAALTVHPYHSTHKRDGDILQLICFAK